MTSSQEAHVEFGCSGTCKIEAVYVDFKSGDANVIADDTGPNSYAGLCEGVSPYNNPQLCKMKRTTNKSIFRVKVTAKVDSKDVTLNAIIKNYEYSLNLDI